MRGSVPGLRSPHPIGQQLPAMYLEDDFAQRFTAGLDEVLAPILLDARLPRRLLRSGARAAGLPGLAGRLGRPRRWTGTGRRSVRRELVRRAVEVHRWQGTARGVALAVRVATGATVEITDSGGVTWSATPTDAPPPDEVPEVRIRVPGDVDEALVRQVVASAVPAHVRATLETQP